MCGRRETCLPNATLAQTSWLAVSARTHAVAPGGLGLVERAVGAGEQLAEVLVLPRGPADADRQAQLASRDGQRARADRGPDVLGHRCGARGVGVGQRDDELLAAEAARDVLRAQALA